MFEDHPFAASWQKNNFAPVMLKHVGFKDGLVANCELAKNGYGES
jgi:hypothetical protein